MALPQITTALPKRRYQLGEFNLVVLGEIESPEPRKYQYLMGVIPEGGAKPELFVTAERQKGGTYLMRVVAERAEQELEQSPNWNDLEYFCLDALLVVKKLLNLMDEQPMQLS